MEVGKDVIINSATFSEDHVLQHLFQHWLLLTPLPYHFTTHLPRHSKDALASSLNLSTS